MKKSMAVLLTAAMGAALLTGCGSSSSTATTAAPASEAASSEAASSEAENNTEADGSYTIGIGQFAEHGSLDNCREGFLAGLAAEGIEEGKNLTVLYENAQADGGTSARTDRQYICRKERRFNVWYCNSYGTG